MSVREAGMQLYSVQPLHPDGTRDGGLVNTEASGPLQAASKVLGEPVSIHGKVPRATVWAMTDSFTPIVTALYVPEAPPAPGTRTKS